MNGSSSSVFDYELDSIGNRVKMTYMDGSYANYSYTSRYWLDGEFYFDSGDNPIDNMSYIYSKTGNRLEQYQNGSTLVQQMTYNAFNQIVNEYDCVSGTTYSYTYDSNGNMTQKTGDDSSQTDNDYNYENRQTGWTDAATTMTNAYSGMNRISHVVNGSETLMLYLGANVFQDRNSSWDLKREYITPGLDENLMMTIPENENNSGNYYYYQDSHRSVVELRSNTEVTVNSYQYRAFGNTRNISIENIENRFQYVGRENDNQGQYYYRNRNYIPQHGRFLSKDPLGSVNYYYYVRNNPLFYIDPFGLRVWGGGPWPKASSGYLKFFGEISGEFPEDVLGKFIDELIGTDLFKGTRDFYENLPDETKDFIKDKLRDIIGQVPRGDVLLFASDTLMALIKSNLTVISEYSTRYEVIYKAECGKSGESLWTLTEKIVAATKNHPTSNANGPAWLVERLNHALKAGYGKISSNDKYSFIYRISWKTSGIVHYPLDHYASDIELKSLNQKFASQLGDYKIYSVFVKSSISLNIKLRRLSTDDVISALIDAAKEQVPSTDDIPGIIDELRGMKPSFGEEWDRILYGPENVKRMQ